MIGGSIGSSDTVNANGGLNISSGGDFTLLNTGAILNSAGTTNLTGYTAVYANDQGTFTAENGSHRLLVGSGTPVFNNAGTFVNDSGSGNTTLIQYQFNNMGNVQAKSGNLQFTGAYTQTAGSTVLNGGTLQSSNPLAINGGTLSGTGTVNANVNVGTQSTSATLSPGASPGEIDINGNLALGSNAISGFDIRGTAQGTQYDFVKVNGSANIGGNLFIDFLNNFTPSYSDVFTILTASSGETGTFSNVLNNKYSDASGTFDVVYTSNSVELTDFQPAAPPVTAAVPEPSSFGGTLAFGVLGGGFLLRRQLKKQKAVS